MRPHEGALLWDTGRLRGAECRSPPCLTSPSLGLKSLQKPHSPWPSIRQSELSSYSEENKLRIRMWNPPPRPLSSWHKRIATDLSPRPPPASCTGFSAVRGSRKEKLKARLATGASQALRSQLSTFFSYLCFFLTFVFLLCFPLWFLPRSPAPSLIISAIFTCGLMHYPRGPNEKCYLRKPPQTLWLFSLAPLIFLPRTSCLC